MKKFGILHKTSSPYVPSSKGIAECAVQTVKSYLHKFGNLQQPKLQALLYRLNNTPSVIPGASSSFVRFFCRTGHIPDLPAIKQNFTPAKTRLCRVHHKEAQNYVAISKKRTDPSLFQVGDKVRVRSPATGKWDKIGSLTELVLGQDDIARSYIIKLERRWRTLQAYVIY